jgi:hypothetical protein
MKIFKGTVIIRGKDSFVITNDRSVQQKVYPLGKGDYKENEEIEFELIPHNSESDEQVEYIARKTLKTI